MFINCKEKNNSNFTVERASDQHFNQVIKATITRNGTYWHPVPCDLMYGEHMDSVVFTLKMHNLKIIKSKKYQENPHWGTFYKIPYLYSSKVKLTVIVCIGD